MFPPGTVFFKTILFDVKGSRSQSKPGHLVHLIAIITHRHKMGFWANKMRSSCVVVLCSSQKFRSIGKHDFLYIIHNTKENYDFKVDVTMVHRYNKKIASRLIIFRNKISAYDLK